MPGYAPPPSRKTPIHGVEVTQTQLQGKWYTPVDGRVKIAEHADPALVRREGAGYHVTSVEIIPVADRWAYHCMVEYPVGSGVVKPGTDFIDTKDASGIAKAETSAIGRALGLHGIACEESIASAEEVEQAGIVEPQSQQSPRTENVVQVDAMNVRGAGVQPHQERQERSERIRYATPEQWLRMRKACELLGYEAPDPASNVTMEQASALLGRWEEEWKAKSAKTPAGSIGSGGRPS